VKIDDAIWGETRFAHDGNGQIASADGTSGTERFSYDAARNVVGASAPSARAGYGGESYRATPIDNWTSTPGGVVKIARGPKGERIRLTHDACGRLIERQVDRDGFRPQRWTYTWDVNDRLVSSFSAVRPEARTLYPLTPPAVIPATICRFRKMKTSKGGIVMRRMFMNKRLNCDWNWLWKL
jgi:YD repeat-containing protein